MAGIILNPSSGSHAITKIECGSSSPYVGGTVDLAQFVFLQEFDGGDNNLSAVSGISNINTLLKLKILGENTVDFVSSDLPPNLQNLDIRGSNTVGGSVNGLPQFLKSIFLTGQTVISGTVADMPSTLEGITIHGSNTISGNLDGMNCPLLTYLNIEGLHTIAGNTDSLPSGLTYFNLSAGSDNETTGSVESLPATLVTYINGTNAVVVGNIGGLPFTLETFSLGGQNTTSGNIANLPSGLKSFTNNGQNTTTGNLKDMPGGIVTYVNRGKNTATGYYDGTVTGAGQRSWAPNMRLFIVQPFTMGMTQQELVTLLIDLSLTSWDPSYAGKTVQIDGPNNPTVNLTTYSSAATAIANLQSKGVEVLVNTTT
jgi:hypothetical protein